MTNSSPQRPAVATPSTASVFTDVDTKLHEVYLPHTVETLKHHFADVAGGRNADAQVSYYLASATRAREHQRSSTAGGAGGTRHTCDALCRQIEKDERFWIVATLLHAFYQEDRVAALSRLLAAAIAATPPVGSYEDWADALGPANELKLYFEARLPAPSGHSAWLAEHLDERVLTPYGRQRAHQKIAASLAKHPALEGGTHTDALLIAPKTGFCVIFEAKVYSDVSTHTTNDALRNQLARTIDLALDRNDGSNGGAALQDPLDKRDPDKTCVVLVTPRLFQDNPGSRLYGHLMKAYRGGTTELHADLPHRRLDELAAVPARLGWITWEKCQELLPGACAWLDLP